MKKKLYLLAGVALLAGISLTTWAGPEQPKPLPDHEQFNTEKPFRDLSHFEIKNLQDESLGRIMDLGIDIVNGRIVEVLVTCDSSLGVGTKIVVVPPRALLADPIDDVYRLNVSSDVFKTAAAIDLSQWKDAGRSDRIAAAYHLFGQVPYFQEEGAPASKTASGRPKMLLGYVERSSRISNLEVKNLNDESFGKVCSMSVDVLKGRILSVVILTPGFLNTKTIIPAMALSFNAARDGLVLDKSKVEYADEPRYIFTEAAYGQKAYSEEESYKGPHTSVALEQGSSYRDVNLTVRINQNIRGEKLDCRHVEVGTIDGRVTLRGWVKTDVAKRRIGEIAIAASHLEVVDNQITVGVPVVVD